MTHEDIENRVFEETGYGFNDLVKRSNYREVSDARKRYMFLLRKAGCTDRYIALLFNRSRETVNRHINEYLFLQRLY
jgi:DNA-binding NarL/FixJ family response regulator